MADEVMNFFESTLAAKDAFVGVVGFGVWELILYTIGITLYALFIWHFHKFIGGRDVFKWNHVRDASGALSRLSEGFYYFIRYLFMYPIVVFLWFVIFASFMFVLGKDAAGANIILISFALVTSIRVMSYYSEKLSMEIAKLVPLALLVVYIVQPNFFAFGDTSARLWDIANFWTDILKYVAFSVAAEWILRIGWSIKQRIAPDIHAPQEINDVRKVVERFGR